MCSKNSYTSDKNNNTLYTEKYQSRIPYKFVFKLFVFTKNLFLLKKKIQSMNLLKQYLKNMIIAKK